MSSSGSSGSSGSEEDDDISQQGDVRKLTISTCLAYTEQTITDQGLLLLLGELLIIHGVEGDRIVLLQVDGELLEVPVLDLLEYDQ